MAAPSLDVDWDAVRTLAIQIGVNEAAREFADGSDELVAAAQKRSQREGWLAHLKPQPLPLSMQPKPLLDEKGNVRIVRSGSEVTGNVLQKLGHRTKLGLASGLAKAADHVATLDGADVLDQAKNIASVAKAASDVHGWKDGSQASLSLRVELLSGAGGDDAEEAPAIDCESEVMPADPLDGY